MKFRVTFKDPDGPYDCIRDAAKSQVGAIEGLEDDERAAVLDERTAKLNAFASKFFAHGEYVTVELDTEAGTATVVPTK